MKRFLSFVVAGGMLSPLAALATPAQFYINPANILVASQLQIDAINFVNYGSFSFSVYPFIPFETFDTLNYTNFGSLTLAPGWRFDHNSTVTGKRDWSANFFNSNPGQVTALDTYNGGSSSLGNPCVVAVVDPSYLLISATNIIAQAGAPTLGASLTAGPNGGIILEGRNIDLTRSGLQILPVWAEVQGQSRVGNPPASFVPDIAVYDQESQQASFTPQNRLNSAGLWNGNTATAPAEPPGFAGFSMFGPASDSFIRSDIQIVIITNFTVEVVTITDTNCTPPVDITVTNQVPVPVFVTARSNVVKGATFVGVPGGFGAGIAFNIPPGAVEPFPFRPYSDSSGIVSVQLSNAVTGQFDTALIEVHDSLPGTGDRGTLPNDVGCGAVTTRPLNFQVDRTSTLFQGGAGGNGTPASDFFTSSSSLELDPTQISIDAVTNAAVSPGDYSGYTALFDNIVTRPPDVPAGAVSNMSGRVVITARSLDLTKTRIRAEGEIRMTTPHLVSSSSAVIDAENLSFNLASTNGNLRIRSLTPASGLVQRLRGPVSFFSAVWQNTVFVTLPNNYVFTNTPIFSDCASSNIIGTNTFILYQTNVTVPVQVAYQVLMMDATRLTTVVPVTVFDLVTHSPNVVVDDNMTIVEKMSIDASDLTLNGDITIPGSFPVNPLTGVAMAGLPLFDWRAANAPRLQNFTNHGSLFVFNEAHFGDDRPYPYLSMVNTGTIDGASIDIDSQSFENRGTLLSQFALNINADSAKLQNGNSRSGLSGASGDTTFVGKNVKFDNYQVFAAANVSFNATESLSDTGPGSGNTFTVQNGINLWIKPQLGDLLGSTVLDETPVVPSIQINHSWAGEDRGPTPAGYLNNVAVGTLQLVPQSPDPLYLFKGTGAHNGLYVDVLDLSQLSDYTNQIQINDNLVIYFAAARLGFTPPGNSNGIPQEPEEFLNGQFGGHLRWVPTYAGPKSSVSTIINGQSTQVNKALFNSQIIDSNGNGIPNALDTGPGDIIAGVTVPLALQVIGNGTVEPNLAGNTTLIMGQTYSMVAHPADGNVFSGWTGSIATQSPVLTFTMANGLQFTATFTFTVTPGSYNGLFFESTGIEFGRSGFITLTAAKGGKCSGSVQVGGKRYSFAGQLDQSGAATIGLPNSGLTMHLQVGGDQLTGTIGDGASWSADILADRAVFNTRTNKAPFAGPFTLAFAGSGDPTNTALPLGAGYATVKVQPTGRVQLNGILADGTKVAQSTSVSKDGRWPLYASLYKGQGQIMGWLTFENRIDRDVGGDVDWIKPADPAVKLYPGGFDFQTTATGSTFNASLHPITGFDFAELSLTGGNLATDLTESLLVNTNNKVMNLGPDKVTLTLSSSQGLFKGSLVNTNLGVKLKLNAVILQKQNIGLGFFPGTNQNGQVSIEPDVP